MHLAAAWPAAPDLKGLVELGYAVRVEAETPAVLPDGRAGLIWLSDGTLRVCGPETRAWRPSRTGVSVVGIRLAVGAVPAVLGVPATALLDRRVHLHELWGSSGQELAERLGRSGLPGLQSVLLLQEAIRARQTGPADLIAGHVARRLAAQSVTVRALAREVGLSERQLHRRCRTATGYAPSQLARLLRLHRFLALAKTRPAAVTLAELAAAAGYADQAHLSHDSRALTGRAPSVFRGPTHVSDPYKAAPGTAL